MFRPQVLFGRRQHAAATAGGIIQRLPVARVLTEHEPDHELYHFARREVLTGGLAGLLRKLTDELLENVAHLMIRDRFGLQVDFIESAEQPRQQTGALQPGGLFGKTETFENVANVRRESFQVAWQQVRIARDAGKINTAGVRLPAEPTQDGEWQNDTAVFRTPVVAAQQIGETPDEADFFLKPVH